MNSFTDTPHQRDEWKAPLLLPVLPTRSIANRLIGGKTYSINRYTFSVETAAPKAALAPEDNLGDSTLAFDAIFDAFQAQRSMLHAFAQLRGDDDADVLG